MQNAECKMGQDFFAFFSYIRSYCEPSARAERKFLCLFFALPQRIGEEKAPRLSPLEPLVRAQTTLRYFGQGRNGRSTHVCANPYKFRFCARILMKKCEHGRRTRAVKQKFLPSATHLVLVKILRLRRRGRGTESICGANGCRAAGVPENEHGEFLGFAAERGETPGRPLRESRKFCPTLPSAFCILPSAFCILH